jgi:hypothetical protein
VPVETGLSQTRRPARAHDPRPTGASPSDRVGMGGRRVNKAMNTRPSRLH